MGDNNIDENEGDNNNELNLFNKIELKGNGNNLDYSDSYKFLIKLISFYFKLLFFNYFFNYYLI